MNKHYNQKFIKQIQKKKNNKLNKLDMQIHFLKEKNNNNNLINKIIFTKNLNKIHKTMNNN